MSIDRKSLFYRGVHRTAKSSCERLQGRSQDCQTKGGGGAVKGVGWGGARVGREGWGDEARVCGCGWEGERMCSVVGGWDVGGGYAKDRRERGIVARCVCVCIYMCVYVYIHVCVYMCVYVYIHVCVYTCVCMCLNIVWSTQAVLSALHTYTYLHTSIPICIPLGHQYGFCFVPYISKRDLVHQ
jgi:hypothetical protein